MILGGAGVYTNVSLLRGTRLLKHSLDAPGLYREVCRSQTHLDTLTSDGVTPLAFIRFCGLNLFVPG